MQQNIQCICSRVRSRENELCTLHRVTLYRLNSDFNEEISAHLQHFSITQTSIQLVYVVLFDDVADTYGQHNNKTLGQISTDIQT